MKQQQPTSEKAHQRLITRRAGAWGYKCKTCSEVFTSSLGLIVHQNKHMSQGTWIRNVPHHKFVCPSTDLPILYHQMGERKSAPLVSRGQGGFYRPRPRKSMVQGPQRLLGHPRSIYDQSQQAMVLQVPHVVAPAPAPASNPLVIQATDLFARRVNQLIPYGIQLNQNAPLDVKPVESVNSSVGSSSSVTITADWMREKENEDQEVEQLDLELRL